jgi:hypothetical protein
MGEGPSRKRNGELVSSKRIESLAIYSAGNYMIEEMFEV